mmetsp:Transcript_14447/g.61994  ORF Transcript_14447/g.61994 Transcript_14447/m.61994 type:complete len:233 (-) Transcript_14447:1814-2512(-)
MLGSSAKLVGFSGARAHCVSLASVSASIRNPALLFSGLWCSRVDKSTFGAGGLGFSRANAISSASRAASSAGDSFFRASLCAFNFSSSCIAEASPASAAATFIIAAASANWSSKPAPSAAARRSGDSSDEASFSASFSFSAAGITTRTSLSMSLSPGWSSNPPPTAATASFPPQRLSSSGSADISFSPGNSSSFHRRLKTCSSVGHGHDHAPVSPFATMGDSTSGVSSCTFS